MADLLFELFSEEIPARMQRPALAALQANLEKALNEARLSYSSLTGFVTPRRIAFLVNGLPSTQPDLNIERKGPKTSAPDQALEGFLRSTGLTKDQLEVRGEGKDACYFAVIEEKGKPSEGALTSILTQLIATHTWPKSMRWNDHSCNWVRPLQNICCIFDGAILPVQYGPVSANNLTFGHRFMAPEAIEISKASDYEQLLKNAKVIVDSEKREEIIRAEMAALAQKSGLSVTDDPALYEEVAGLVEWPVILMGSIDNGYMDLPQEVLRSEMRNHQKYFSLEDANGAMAAKFLITSNLIAQDNGNAITHGNERVLRARLADGRFYWDQDRKKALSDWAAGLKDVVFHAKLGSMAYRVERIKEMAGYLCDFVPGVDKKHALRAAALAKADLVTGMVGEFPELQGVMGRYYAIEQKEAPEIADAILDHYLPLGPTSPCPTEPTAAVVALSDKLDMLAGLFAIGEKPTGSKDPFALRRAALGVIRIILENELRIPLHKAFTQALSHYINLENKTGSNHEIADDLLAFFLERFKVMLKGDGIRHDIVTAVFANEHSDDLTVLLRKVKALSGFLTSEDAPDLLAAYNRANNIVQIEAKKDKQAFDAEPKVELLEQDEEQKVFSALNEMAKAITLHLSEENYESAFQSASALRQPMDAFFEKVTVNANDNNLRHNRLLLLAKASRELHKLADFSKIEQ